MENYTIIEEIFEGSSGKIYKVQRIQDQKIFACKELNYGSMNEKQKQQLISEVNILRELKGQYIVRCYERIIDKKNQRILLILDYCENGDLQRLIQKQKVTKQKFKEQQIWSFIIQLIQAIFEIHRKKSGIILHRDIKPSNILLDENFNLKLNDFGYAKLVQEDKFQQTGFAQIQYMSPEQLNENIFTEKTDIWAFSCLIYEIMFLRAPFEAQNQMLMALNINKQQVEFQEGYSKELQRFVNWGLEKDHRKRPSIDELMSFPEISFHIRQKRLNENQVFIQKKQNEIDAKKINLDQRQSQLDIIKQKLLQKDEDLKIQHQKLLKIYEDSLQEQRLRQDNQEKQKFFMINKDISQIEKQKNVITQENSNKHVRHNSLDHKQDLYEQDKKNNQNPYANQKNFFMELKMKAQPLSQFSSQLLTKNKYLIQANKKN